MSVIQPLDSLDNKAVRVVRRLLTNRHFRERQQQAVIEGFHMLKDVVDVGMPIHLVLYGKRMTQSEAGRSLLARLQMSRVRLIYVTDKVLDALSAVETHQGVLAVVNLSKPVSGWPLPKGVPAFIVIAYQIQDPGNLGTLIRSVQAAGAHIVGVTKGTVDVYNPKTIRAAAGSVFKLPIISLSDNWVEELSEKHITVVSTVVAGGQTYTQFDWRQPFAIVMGNEGNGLPQELVSKAQTLTIPMVPTAESLNVAVAGSILAFHAMWVREQHHIPLVPPVMIQ
ncbi:TrmH family RNA methyltransferase [Sulfobacillus thermosulfidooxidans]|uniref:TrmH family RNA methyltransferase n=1 Tax=Sulfobacillus thermosulfidooxidans TaxID=28034 RepID=UPI0006B69FA0|nr:RNA methyltransferase [Sulfobacillus thermosulfidooxidans]